MTGIYDDVTEDLLDIRDSLKAQRERLLNAAKVLRDTDGDVVKAEAAWEHLERVIQDIEAEIAEE